MTPKGIEPATCHRPDIHNNGSSMHKSTNQLKVNKITSVKVMAENNNNNNNNNNKTVRPAMFLQFLLTTANSIVTEGVSCGY
jgi:hypothetical protein